MNHAATSLRPAAQRAGAARREYVWQLPIRIFHWTTALSVVVLIATGLFITFPIWPPSGEAYEHFLMGRVRQVHFAAAFVFTIGFPWRVYWYFMGNRHARSGLPRPWRAAWWRALFGQASEYLRMKFDDPPLGHNALAGLSYVVFVAGLGLAQILTGFALYAESNPGGILDRLFGWVVPLLGGSFRTHMWHHLFAWGFVLFILLHVYIVLLDASQYRNGLLRSMITGDKLVRGEEQQRD